MTTTVLRRIGQVWTTLLVVYGLLLAGFAPIPAPAFAAGIDGPICTGTALASGPAHPSDPGDADHHGATCCILCQVPASRGPRASDAAGLRLLPIPVATHFAPGPPSYPTRASPGAVPQSPRAPPIPS